MIDINGFLSLLYVYVDGLLSFQEMPKAEKPNLLAETVK